MTGIQECNKHVMTELDDIKVICYTMETCANVFGTSAIA